ncbi:MAG TPA: CapA family protein [Thermoanaerobaculia bacterium]|nr:CapA family protein [Thermoanaerobaculia bacterium]
MRHRRTAPTWAALVLAPAFAFAAPAPTPSPTPAALFDPRRPPERELDTRVPDGFTVAAVGDLITTRPLVERLPADPGFAAVVKILRDADVAFGNFETTAIDLDRFTGSSYPGKDDWALAASPAVAKDLRALGFGLVGRANNHALDYGVEGMRETSRWLDEAGIAWAGVGENRAQARAARFVETPAARVGLVSMASTYRDGADALPAFGRAPGRAGLNALRTTTTLALPAETLLALKSVKDALDAPHEACERTPREAARRKEDSQKAGEGLSFLDTRFVVGSRAERRYAMNGQDLEEILRSVRLGKQHSDLLLVSIHSHDTGLGCDEPGDFLPKLAHAAIDAGAGAFLGSGEHRLMPIEIYKGRPIFYSLANFFWSDMQEGLPADRWEDYRDLLGKAFGDPAKATDADLNALVNADGFDDERVFQTLVAVCRWDKGSVAEVRLYPVDLGYGEPLTRSGVPRLAAPAVARAILERLQRISRPFGTTIAIEGSVGVIRVR